MKRTIRRLAVPLAGVLLLAGCGSTNDSTKPTEAEQQTAASDGGAAVPMDDGGDDTGYTPSAGDACDVNMWDEADGECEDVASFEPMSLEGAFGFSESGGTFTLGSPEAAPTDLAELLSDAGIADEDIAKVQMIPVEIDNSEGFESDNLSGATGVTEDGEQHEYQQLGGYLYDVAEQYAEAEKSGMGDPVYDELWDRKDEAYADVAPTAKSTQYLVIDDDTDLSGKFTYFELRSGDYGTPFPTFPKLD